MNIIERTHFVFSDAIPVEDEELEADVVQRRGGGRQVENERLVENGIERPLLDVRLLLGHPLPVVHQVDLDVGIGESGHVHSRDVAGLEDDGRQSGRLRLVAQRDEKFTASVRFHLTTDNFN